ncbi:hypothetical protein AB0G67_46160 [Streptomyces sp. NPDC021056]
MKRIKMDLDITEGIERAVQVQLFQCATDAVNLIQHALQVSSRPDLLVV